MINEYLIYFFTAFAASLLGAIPFGLVNLSVLQVAVNRGQKATWPVAYGATVIEIGYAIIGLLTGNAIFKLLNNEQTINGFIFWVLTIMGIVFLIRKNQVQNSQHSTLGGFFYGVMLNLLSLQVLLYWIIASGYLISSELLIISPSSVVLFLAAIWIGKMAVLHAYAVLGRQIITRSQKISANINRIIGSILIALAMINAFRYFV
ncbi:MAG: LysE family transporter [Bacteroidota bacterium]